QLHADQVPDADLGARQKALNPEAQKAEKDDQEEDADQQNDGNKQQHPLVVVEQVSHILGQQGVHDVFPRDVSYLSSIKPEGSRSRPRAWYGSGLLMSNQEAILLPKAGPAAPRPGGRRLCLPARRCSVP